jgi:hypothetical protein
MCIGIEDRGYYCNILHEAEDMKRHNRTRETLRHLEHRGTTNHVPTVSKQ